MPRVQAYRDDIDDENWLDCSVCPKRMGKIARRMWHCGFEPERSWLGMGHPFDAGGRVKTSVCPGYTITLPEVYETCRALWWRKDGQLEHLYDDPLTPVMRVCIDYLASAISETERDVMKAQKKKFEAEQRRHG